MAVYDLNWAVKPQTDNESEFLAPCVSTGPFCSEAEFGVWQEELSLCPVSHVPPMCSPFCRYSPALVLVWSGHSMGMDRESREQSQGQGKEIMQVTGNGQ